MLYCNLFDNSLPQQVVVQAMTPWFHSRTRKAYHALDLLTFDPEQDIDQWDDLVEEQLEASSGSQNTYRQYVAIDQVNRQYCIGLVDYFLTDDLGSSYKVTGLNIYRISGGGGTLLSPYWYYDSRSHSIIVPSNHVTDGRPTEEVLEELLSTTRRSAHFYDALSECYSQLSSDTFNTSSWLTYSKQLGDFEEEANQILQTVNSTVRQSNLSAAINIARDVIYSASGVSDQADDSDQLVVDFSTLTYSSPISIQGCWEVVAGVAVTAAAVIASAVSSVAGIAVAAVSALGSLLFTSKQYDQLESWQGSSDGNSILIQYPFFSCNDVLRIEDSLIPGSLPQNRRYAPNDITSYSFSTVDSDFVATLRKVILDDSVIVRVERHCFTAFYFPTLNDEKVRSIGVVMYPKIASKGLYGTFEHYNMEIDLPGPDGWKFPRECVSMLDTAEGLCTLEECTSTLNTLPGSWTGGYAIVGMATTNAIYELLGLNYAYAGTTSGVTVPRELPSTIQVLTHLLYTMWNYDPVEEQAEAVQSWGDLSTEDKAFQLKTLQSLVATVFHTAGSSLTSNYPLGYLGYVASVNDGLPGVNIHTPNASSDLCVTYISLTPLMFLSQGTRLGNGTLNSTGLLLSDLLLPSVQLDGNAIVAEADSMVVGSYGCSIPSSGLNETFIMSPPAVFPGTVSSILKVVTIVALSAAAIVAVGKFAVKRYRSARLAKSSARLSQAQASYLADPSAANLKAYTKAYRKNQRLTSSYGSNVFGSGADSDVGSFTATTVDNLSDSLEALHSEVDNLRSFILQLISGS